LLTGQINVPNSGVNGGGGWGRKELALRGGSIAIASRNAHLKRNLGRLEGGFALLGNQSKDSELAVLEWGLRRKISLRKRRSWVP